MGATKLSQAGLRGQAERLRRILQRDTFALHPPYEKLLGDLAGAFSRRITIHHPVAGTELGPQRHLPDNKGHDHPRAGIGAERRREGRSDAACVRRRRSWTGEMTSQGAVPTARSTLFDQGRDCREMAVVVVKSVPGVLLIRDGLRGQPIDVSEQPAADALRFAQEIDSPDPSSSSDTAHSAKRFKGRCTPASEAARGESERWKSGRAPDSRLKRKWETVEKGNAHHD